MLSCLHDPIVREKLEVWVSRRKGLWCEMINKTSFAFYAKSLNISEKKDQYAFSSDETVTDLAGVTASWSPTFGAVCESTSWLIIFSFYNHFL